MQSCANEPVQNDVGAVDDMREPDQAPEPVGAAIFATLKDFFFYAPGRILPAALNLLLLLAATRLLSPAEVGRYGLVASTLLFIAMLLGAWLDQSTIRFLPASQPQQRQFLSVHARVLSLLLIAGVVATVLVFALPRPVSMTAVGVAAAALVTGVLVLFNSIQSVAIAKGCASRYATLEIGRALGTLLFGILAIFLWQSRAEAMILGWAISLLIVSLLAYSWYRPLYAGQQEAPALAQHTRQWASYGLPLAGWFLGSQILSLTDRYVISHFLGEAAVGIYHANFQLVWAALNLALAPIVMAAHPQLLRASESLSRFQLETLLSRLTRLFLMLSLPLLLLTTFVGMRLLPVILGPGYEEGALLVPWIAAAAFLWNLGMFAHKRLEIARQPGWMVVSIGVCALANVALNLLLVPLMGLTGAAIATAGAYLLYPWMVTLHRASAISWTVEPRVIARLAISLVFGLAIGVAATHALTQSALWAAFLPGTLSATGFLCGAVLLGEIRLHKLMKLWRSPSR